MTSRSIVLLLLSVVFHSAFATNSDPEDLAMDMERKVGNISAISFHPGFLPIILRNRDFIGLSEAQVDAFLDWRHAHFDDMVKAMNSIIKKRVLLQEAAISPLKTPDDLRLMQEEIFDLQREVLDYRLSCRENVMKTFDEDNWIAFLMVLADEGFAIPDGADGAAFARVSYEPQR